MSDVKRDFAVNENLETAIAAHQDALRDGDAELGHLLLRVVVMARTPAKGDLQRLHDYLDGLPLTAWPADRGEPADIREATLAGIARSIAWRIDA